MAKHTYRGLVTDPNDSAYKRGWRVTFSPTSKKNSKESSQEKPPPKTPELTTQIETEGEGVCRKREPAVEPELDTKEVHSPSNTEKFFAINKRAIVLAILVALLVLALVFVYP